MIRFWRTLNLGRRDVMVFLMCLCVCSSLWVNYITPQDADKVPQKLVTYDYEIPQKLAKTTVNNQNPLWITLAKQILSKQSRNTNVVFSPLSIQGILGLMAAGSNGETLDQLLSFLKTKTLDELNTRFSKIVSLMADGSSSGGPRLSFVNGAWIDQTCSLKTSFKHILTNVYRAVCKQVDFKNKASGVVKEVNSWAKKQTNGLINEILPAHLVSSLTRLILSNAVYFKGSWKVEFDPSMTKESDFHLLNGEKVKVPFMNSDQDQLVHEYDGFKVLGLPYQHGKDKRRFTMYILLPNTRNKHGLAYLLNKISSESDFLDSHIPREKVKVGRFMIPKFKISFEFEASDMLKELGLKLPFTNGGLTEMADKGLNVSFINHKAFVEVNEQGTEAAALTDFITFGITLGHRVDFVADHPFLFMIREDVSGEVLFMGQVVNPSVR